MSAGATKVVTRQSRRVQSGTGDAESRRSSSLGGRAADVEPRRSMRRDRAEWVEPRGPIRGVQVEGAPSRGVPMRGGRAEEDQCEGGRTKGWTEGAEELSGRGPEGPRTGAAEDWTGGAEDRRSRGGVDRSSWPIAGDRRASSAGAVAHRTEWPNVGRAEMSEWAEQIECFCIVF